MTDVLVIGGGVIGLSTAWQLALRGRRVLVVERNVDVGRESSWAGAGIVPPGAVRPGDAPLAVLHGHAVTLHREWTDRLRRETGVDNGFRPCGAVYLADDADLERAVEEEAAAWRGRGIVHQPLDAEALATYEPGLAEAARANRFRASFAVADEAQVRNPWHLRALETICRQAGVQFVTDAPLERFVTRNGRLDEIVTRHGTFAAEQAIVCGGAWTGELAQALDLRLQVRPIRGQIALLHLPQPALRRVVNVGKRYLVPRDEGRVLVGSTEEDVGFDKRNTDEAIADLLVFARSLVPPLAAAAVELTWAGLRPFSADGLPYLGRVPSLSNVFVAAGHYRWGITLSPATAVAMAQLMCNEPTLLDLTPFRLDR
jgi:glycine oxidase